MAGPATVATTPKRSRVDAAWAGVAFAVLYVLGTMTAFVSPSDTDKVKDSPNDLAASWYGFYAKSGNRTTIIIGTYVLIAAALAFMVFGSALRDRLAAAGAPGAGRVAYGSSIAFAAVTLVGAAAVAWIPGAKTFGGVALPTGELNYLASQLGFAMILLGGGAAAGLALVAAGQAGARTHLLPGWLGWFGVVVGVIVFFLGGLFVTMALLVLWVLIASIILLRRPASASAA